MTTDSIADADTIVLIHGLWMTPRMWEHWIPRYERRGFRAIAPAYPGFEVEVEALRADPTPIERVTVPDTAGIAIDSVPTEGVRTLPASRIRATFPVLHNPANRHRAVGFTPRQFQYAFTNTLSQDQSAAVYERYHIAAPGRWVSDGVLANLTPGHQDTWVNYGNGERAPLLFIAGGEDHITPAAVNKENADRYARSAAHTDYKEFPGRDHYGDAGRVAAGVGVPLFVRPIGRAVRDRSVRQGDEHAGRCWTAAAPRASPDVLPGGTSSVRIHRRSSRDGAWPASGVASRCLR